MRSRCWLRSVQHGSGRLRGDAQVREGVAGSGVGGRGRRTPESPLTARTFGRLRWALRSVAMKALRGRAVLRPRRPVRPRQGSTRQSSAMRTGLPVPSKVSEQSHIRWEVTKGAPPLPIHGLRVSPPLVILELATPFCPGLLARADGKCRSVHRARGAYRLVAGADPLFDPRVSFASRTRRAN